ncbi:peptidyl-tRNA hydrolase [Microbispora triticiradicis]|uniref:peptidyl-tRNA hydrolase n=1 Tax=Microbispora triticiradicis TaxID=2200763 RepID=A0ABX9LQS4_9ACTN|nr:peptidyl-tRNA hydrolase [Microbispora triticiradicis]
MPVRGAYVVPRRHACPGPARSCDPCRVTERVLPLVVRIERAAPPRRTDALEAAATAVPRLLDHAEKAENAENADAWGEEIAEWQDGRIRKVVRRARGAEWRRALALPGITVTVRTAEVRVHPPVPLDDWPRDLARLQVSGTDLADDAVPPEPGPDDVVLWVNPRLTMTAGKAMAQAGHGAQFAWWGAGEADRAAWRGRGFAVRVRTAGPDRWDALAGSGLPVVRDAGFTEIEPGSATVVADAPWLRAGVPEV